MTAMGPAQPGHPDDRDDPSGQGDIGPPRPRTPSGQTFWPPPVTGEPSAGPIRMPSHPGEPSDHAEQAVLLAIGGAVRDIDLHRLAYLTPDEVTAQAAARWALYNYIDQLWSDLKAAGLEELDPQTRQSLAGLRDLLSTLCSNTDQFRFRP